MPRDEFYGEMVNDGINREGLTYIPADTFKPTKDPVAAFMDRIAAIEARQRAYEMHDPDCPRLVDEQAQCNADWMMGLRPCSCWLSEETQ